MFGLVSEYSAMGLVTEINCKYVVSEMLYIFTSVPEIFWFPVCGK